MATPVDLSNPSERQRWRYDSEVPLSAAQLIAAGSVDVWTAALVWLLLERGASLTVAGPRSLLGIGKTTTLNALLQFLPAGTRLCYMAGMLEDFAFTRSSDGAPGATCAISNELNWFPPFYMWGEVARRYLTLPAQGYRVATTVHADTLGELIALYREDLRLPEGDLRRLGLVVHIAVPGPPCAAGARRWVTTHFLWQEPGVPDALLSLWRREDDTFVPAEESVLAALATWAGLGLAELTAAIARREACLRTLSGGTGADVDALPHAIAALRRQERDGLGLSTSPNPRSQ
jgi:hypothetical protein